MPQYYKMRARDTACGPLTYVTWVVEGAPDTTGVQAGVLPCGVDENDLADIQVIHSWVEGSSPERIGTPAENNLASWDADGNLKDSNLVANPIYDEEDPPNLLGVEVYGVTYLEVDQVFAFSPIEINGSGGAYVKLRDQAIDPSYGSWACGTYAPSSGIFNIAPVDNGYDTGPSHNNGIRLLRYTTSFDAEGQTLQSIQCETEGGYVEASVSNYRTGSADTVTPLVISAFALMHDQTGNDLALEEGYTYIFTCVLDLMVTGGLKSLATLSVVAWRPVGGPPEWSTPTLAELAGAGTNRSWGLGTFTVSEVSDVLMLEIELDLTGDSLATDCLVSIGHMRTPLP